MFPILLPVAAIGRPEFVPGAWIKPGAAVIDVGINNVDDPTRKSGKRMVGDVNFNEAKEVAGFLTPGCMDGSENPSRAPQRAVYLLVRSL